MNVYCVKCGGEMEIMRDLGSELRVYPCGCGGNSKTKRQPTQRALDGSCQCRKYMDGKTYVIEVTEGCPIHTPRQ